MHERLRHLEIKRKHLAKAFAVGEITLIPTILSSSALMAISSELPIEYKVVVTTNCVGLSALCMADGAIDLAKETHHYLLLQIWKRLTKNPETKAKIDIAIKDFADSKEDKIKLF